MALAWQCLNEVIDYSTANRCNPWLNYECSAKPSTREKISAERIVTGALFLVSPAHFFLYLSSEIWTRFSSLDPKDFFSCSSRGISSLPRDSKNVVIVVEKHQGCEKCELGETFLRYWIPPAGRKRERKDDSLDYVGVMKWRLFCAACPNLEIKLNNILFYGVLTFFFQGEFRDNDGF